jgi:hypothetical protein
LVVVVQAIDSNVAREGPPLGAGAPTLNHVDAASARPAKGPAINVTASHKATQCLLCVITPSASAFHHVPFRCIPAPRRLRNLDDTTSRSVCHSLPRNRGIRHPPK